MLELVTILDLNEDCWNLVLDYVPVQDIIRSERISKRWQEVVLKYLSRIPIGIVMVKPFLAATEYFKTIPRICWVQMVENGIESFCRWTKKLGASIVCAYCNEKNLQVMGENCFNLKAALFEGLNDEQLLNNQSEIFIQLQELIFDRCLNVSDECLNKFIGSTSLQNLKISCNYQMTGECLANIKSTTLKCLTLEECHALQSRFLAAASNHFSELIKFELYEYSEMKEESLRENLMLALKNMPKLEHLDLLYIFYTAEYMDNVFEVFCQLKNLKFLTVAVGVTDDELVALGQSCQELRFLDIHYCPEVSIRGLLGVGRRLQTLAAHGIGSDHLTDADVGALVRACPDLTELDVSACYDLTEAAEARAAAARRDMRARRPLRLIYNPDPEYPDANWPRVVMIPPGEYTENSE